MAAGSSIRIRFLIGIGRLVSALELLAGKLLRFHSLLAASRSRTPGSQRLGIDRVRLLVGDEVRHSIPHPTASLDAYFGPTCLSRQHWIVPIESRSKPAAAFFLVKMVGSPVKSLSHYLPVA